MIINNKTASISIDVGGTFTDCYACYDDKIVFTKTPTTPRNLSVGFMQAVRDSADMLNIKTEQLLNATDAIRYSTTVAMNNLIQKKGPRLGLITTEGYEDTI